jgi:hypothetical protein
MTALRISLSIMYAPVSKRMTITKQATSIQAKRKSVQSHKTYQTIYSCLSLCSVRCGGLEKSGVHFSLPIGCL